MDSSWRRCRATSWGTSIWASISVRELSGSISPVLYLGDVYNLPSLQFINTVYSAGSTTFSGKFDSALSGANSFSGLFTGPAAQELLGSLAFPYTSPVDSKNYQAAGAFVAKRH